MNVGDVNVEDMNVEDVNVEDVNVEDVNVEDVNVEDVNVEDVNVEDALVQTGTELHVGLQVLHRRVQKTLFRAWYMQINGSCLCWILTGTDSNILVFVEKHFTFAICQVTCNKRPSCVGRS